jgi:tRNA pseudouridine38-40 synthase
VPEKVPLSQLEALGESDWGVASAVEAPEGFHAQWSSVWKEYRYRLALGPVPPTWVALAWEVNSSPSGTTFDLERFGTALHRARGHRDFSAFEAGSRVRRPRTLLETGVLRAGSLVEVRLRGDGFGRYGVRLLVGGAVLVATGRLGWSEWEAALNHAAPIRGLRAPAGGLTLWTVGYPEGKDPFEGAAERVPAVPPFVPVAQE